MTENPENPKKPENPVDRDTQNLEAAAPPPPTTPPPAAPPAAPDQPRRTWRDRRVGVVTLAVSTVAALVIGGAFGTAAGGLVGYGVGHHDRPDRPAVFQRQGQPQQLQPPSGELPPGMLPEGSDGSGGSQS